MHVQRHPAADSLVERSDPVVVYIAGSGRSGSTLVERMLGGIPGTVNLGELLDLPRRVAPYDERCGCGTAFSVCPYWTAVGQRLTGGWNADGLRSLHELQKRVARQRHLPRLLGSPHRGRFGQDLAEYAARMRAVYRAAAEVANADIVVDASKWPSLALALHRGGIDLRVIHLVRDVRGVANSLAHGSVVRPHSRGDVEERMYRNHSASAAGRWLATQAETDVLSVTGLLVTRVRYEDVVADPGPVLLGALADLGIAVPAGGFSHIEGRRVNLHPSHGLSGNPSRFSSGEMSLRPDLRWRDDMSTAERALVQAIGSPWALRYRHAGRRAASATPTSYVPVPAAAAPDATGATPDAWPLVSAVVATRGRPELVREAVGSAVQQDYAGDLEVVVVHDQERPDETLRELARPGRTVILTENAHSPGLAGARNTGIGLAKGQFIATLDDDDRWRPEKVRRQVQRFNSDPDPLMLGTGLRLLLPGGRTSDWRGRAPRIRYETLLRNRVKELHSSTLMMRRDAFAKAGRYDEQLPRGYAEDYDWVLRVGRVGPIGLVPEPLAEIRKDNQSYYRGRAAETAPALLHFLAKHPEIAADRRGHARVLGQVAFALSSSGERRRGVPYAVRSWARWPLSVHAYVAFAHIVSGADPATFVALARRFGRGMA